MRKNQIISLVVLVMLAIGFGYLASNTKPWQNDFQVATQDSEERVLCFYDSVQQPGGVEDQYSMALRIAGEDVTGTLHISPGDEAEYQKNARLGSLRGTVGPLDPMTMSRTVEANWTAEVDLKNVSTQVRIQFGDGSAAVAFGKTAIDGNFFFGESEVPEYTLQLSQVACPEEE